MKNTNTPLTNATDLHTFWSVSNIFPTGVEEKTPTMEIAKIYTQSQMLETTVVKKNAINKFIKVQKPSVLIIFS